MDKIQKKFNINNLENNGIKRMQVNEKHVESIEINDENFMEIVEKTLASIKKQYKTKNTINIEN